MVYFKDSPIFGNHKKGIDLYKAVVNVGSEDIGQLEKLKCWHPFFGHAHPLSKPCGQIDEEIFLAECVKTNDDDSVPVFVGFDQGHKIICSLLLQ